MKKIASFTIDHIRLSRGIFVFEKICKFAFPRCETRFKSAPQMRRAEDVLNYLAIFPSVQ
jgi:hypothetical protein